MSNFFITDDIEGRHKPKTDDMESGVELVYLLSQI